MRCLIGVYPHKYFILLLVLLSLLTLHPLMEGYPGESMVFNLLVSLMLLVVSLLVTSARRRCGLTWLLALPTMAICWFAQFAEWTLLGGEGTVWACGALLVFHCYAVACVFVDLMSYRDVSRDELIGVVCLYTLLGATWSLAYYLMALLVPGSFHTTLAGQVDTHVTWYDMLYLSFITLGGVGYGDITPVHGAARNLAILESIAGTFYIAVVVAKLMSMFVGKARYPSMPTEGEGTGI